MQVRNIYFRHRWCQHIIALLNGSELAFLTDLINKYSRIFTNSTLIFDLKAVLAIPIILCETVPGFQVI